MGTNANRFKLSDYFVSRKTFAVSVGKCFIRESV